MVENGIATGRLWTFCAYRRHESLSLWILWRPGARVHLLPQHGQPLPEAHLRLPPGPDRHAKRIEVPRVEYEKLSDDRLGEPSAAIRGRVEAARARQRMRFEGTRLLTNADMGPAVAAPNYGCKGIAGTGSLAHPLIRVTRSVSGFTEW